MLRRTGILAAALGALPVAGCEDHRTLGVPAYNPPLLIPEADARELLLEAFTTRGLTIAEDYAFGQDTVAFEADGFNASKSVGYEYTSAEDDAPDWQEEEQLSSWHEGTGPHFLVLHPDDFSYHDPSARDYARYETEAEALEAMRAQIDTFLNDLESRGIL